MLSSYMPMDRRQALARGAPLPDRTQGAALMADISGFTPLTAALVEALGPQRGAEELTRQLNGVYEALIAEVDQYGGSVVVFSGDAITGWFDGDDGWRATACALAWQRAMARFRVIPLPSGHTATLTVKAAVARGPVRRFLVGDPQQGLMDVLAGATLDRLAAAEQHALAGEVVLEEHAGLVLEADGATLIWRPDPTTGMRFATISALPRDVPPQPWPVLGNETGLEAVRPWLLPPVFERLRQGQEAFLAEIRPVVALFLDFGGIDYDDDPAAWAKLDAYIRWVQRVLTHYEGALLDVTIGDKGSYLYGVFGAPLAHADDVDRALAAALELRAPPADLQPGRRDAYITGVQIGLSGGPAYAGAYGGPTRRTYSVLGDEVNLAARLMQAAPVGRVLVSRRLAEVGARHFEFQDLGLRTVKGKVAPVPVALLAGRRAPTLPSATGGRAEPGRPAPTAMVGRSAERAALAEMLDGLAHDGRSGVVLIEGEAGLGKSRLVEEAGRLAAARAVQVLGGGADAVEQSTPYYAWRPVFSRLFGLDSPPPAADARAAVTALAADPQVARLAPLLNAVLPLDLPDTPATATLAGPARADATRDLLARLLDGAARRPPLVLILEDAHWMDSASWALAAAVCGRTSALLLVLATRPLGDGAPPEYRRLRDGPNTRLLRLETLGPAEIDTLIGARLGVTILPTAVRRLIQERAEGNPFFSEELAYALRDAGLIEVSGGICRVAPGVGDLRTVSLPDTVQGVITSRIDRLAPQQQLTLKVASVIGRVFDFRTLDAIYPIQTARAQLGEDLAVLQKLDLTPMDTPEPELAYIFKHIITQEVAYNLMLFAQRRGLHQAIAAWYEATYTADPAAGAGQELAPFYTLLAHHWQAAEVPAKAADYLIRAGDAALRLFANAEARRHYTAALTSLRRLPDEEETRRRHVDTLIKLVSVAFASHEPAHNLALLAEAEALAHHLPDSVGAPDGDRARLAQIHYWMIRQHYLAGHPDEVIRYYQVTLGEAQAVDDRKLLATLSSTVGWMMNLQGHFEKSGPILTAALTALEGLGNWQDWTFTAGHLGMSLAARGDLPAAFAATERALARAQEINYLTGEALIYTIRAFVCLMAGDLPRMQTEAETGVAVAGRSGDLLLTYIGHSYGAWAAARRGQAAAAQASQAAAQAVSSRLGGRLLLADWFAAMEAEVALVAGDAAESCRLAERAVALAGAMAGTFAMGLAERAWGLALARADSPPWAEIDAHLAAALAAHEPHECRPEAARTRLVWGRLYLARNDRPTARPHLERAAALFAACGIAAEEAEARAVLSAEC